MASPLWPLQVFDPEADVNVIERRRPHWSQAGTVCFITWRTNDLISKSVLRRWHADREQWLLQHGVDPKADDWKGQLRQLDRPLQHEFTRTFADRWHEQLDACHGESVLRRRDCATIVADSLLHFDGERYEVMDFIVMPNHIHLLAAFRDEDAMLKQCEGWKHFQATQINRLLGKSGRFWQQDGFDHLVRSVEQLETLRRYIAANPMKAGLKKEEYLHYSKGI